MNQVNFHASRMPLRIYWVHEIRFFLSPSTSIVFILLPVCSVLAFWWPTQDIPCSWSLYITPGFTAYIPFLDTGPLRAAIQVTGATRVVSVPRPQPSLALALEDQRGQTLPTICLKVAAEPLFELLVQGNMLPHKTAVCSVRNLCLEIVSIIAWESASL